jgi:RNA polymerase sigma-70 factor (ECF subfamily)
MSIDQSLDRNKAGDAAALESLLLTYQNGIFRLALSILDDAQDAEDVAQEVLIAAMKGLDSFRGESSLKTWLYTITLNRSRNRLRSRRGKLRLVERIKSALLAGGNNPLQPEEATIQSEADALLWGAVQSLDEAKRLPVVLRYYNNLPVSEIADILKLPIGTVHSRLNAARTRLKKALRDWESRSNE